MNSHRYSKPEIAGVERVIRERRDIRHFVPGTLPEGLLARLIDAACRAPSVGYMQPWRFVRVATTATRDALMNIVETERQATAAALPTRNTELFAMPAGAHPVAILCIGPAVEFPPAPLLETQGWGQRLSLDEVLFEERWKVGAGGTAPAY